VLSALPKIIEGPSHFVQFRPAIKIAFDLESFLLLPYLLKSLLLLKPFLLLLELLLLLFG
jgi:hypothetical protein